MNARLNIIPVKRGCGSGSAVAVNLIQFRSRLKGNAAAYEWLLFQAKRLRLSFKRSSQSHLRLSRRKRPVDEKFGSTRTVPSYACAIFDGLRKTYNLITQVDWVK